MLWCSPLLPTHTRRFILSPFLGFGTSSSYHRLHHPSVPLGLLLARPEPGLVVVCLRKQAGSPSLVLLKTTQPLPYLASCRASSPAEPTALEPPTSLYF